MFTKRLSKEMTRIPKQIGLLAVAVFAATSCGESHRDEDMEEARRQEGGNQNRNDQNGQGKEQGGQGNKDKPSIPRFPVADDNGGGTGSRATEETCSVDLKLQSVVQPDTESGVQNFLFGKVALSCASQYPTVKLGVSTAHPLTIEGPFVCAGSAGTYAVVCQAKSEDVIKDGNIRIEVILHPEADPTKLKARLEMAKK